MITGHLRGEKPTTLTPRQQEAFRLMCQGLSNTEIAARMGIRRETVQLYSTTIAGIVAPDLADTRADRWLVAFAYNEGYRQGQADLKKRGHDDDER